MQKIRSPLIFIPMSPIRFPVDWKMGLGAIYRVTEIKKNWGFDQSNPMWGVTSFTTLRLFKSTRLRAELDASNYPLSSGSNDASVKRVWRGQFVAGIQNNFKISKSFHGNVQLLYNFDKKLKDAFPEKLSVGVGIQYKLSNKNLK